MHSFSQCTPSVFDTVITDISTETLKSQISHKLRHTYLSPLSQTESQDESVRTGIIYGVSNRSFISIPTRFKKNKPIWIHYFVDTGSLHTYLTSQSINALLGPNIQPFEPLPVFINGRQTTIRKSTNRFDTVNILGMDFLLNGKKLSFEFIGLEKSPTFTITF